MSTLKTYSKRSFWGITVFFIILGSAVLGSTFYCIDWILASLSTDIPQDTVLNNVGWVVEKAGLANSYFYKAVIPGVIGFFIVLGCLLWIILRSATSSLLKSDDSSGKNIIEQGKKKKDFLDQKIEQERKRRLFLHTLSVFQREGRLLDFFDEDLSLYDDEQIGAAVRSIQEDCKKAVKKYIDPKPVMEKEEGDTVVVEDGFDMDAVSLVGNVSGNPPFEGILKHRGWKAGKKDIPKLSDIQDSTVITPAEIEIQ